MSLFFNIKDEKAMLNGTAGGGRLNEPDQDGVIWQQIREQVSEYVPWLKQMSAQRTFSSSYLSLLMVNISQILADKSCWVLVSVVED